MAALAGLWTPPALAIGLKAPAAGTFTMNLDRAALAVYFGYHLSNYWDAAASDYADPAHSGNGLASQITPAEIPAVNQVFELVPVGVDPVGQAPQRFVQATSANFTIDTVTLEGVAGAQVGMTGVQGFYAPQWPPAGGGLVNGDFSVAYDSTRLTDGRSGWYLANNIFFTLPVYDLDHLNLVFTDPDNWQLSGDLLMSPENGGMLQGPSLNDVGDFCLGTGSFAGCGQVAAVPVPAALWLLGSGMLGLGRVLFRSAQPLR